jgi:hypothetical protein
VIVEKLEFYLDNDSELPSFPMNLLEIIGKPPREEPIFRLDRLARPDETEAAFDASDAPKIISEP